MPPFDLNACRSAQRLWAAWPLRDRLSLIRKFRQSLVGAADELLAAVEADVGRPPGEVLGSDLLPLADAISFLESSAHRWLAPRKVSRPPLWLMGQRDMVHRRPWGVVGIIGTWNYPLLLNGVQIIQALAAGNGVLYKPSEFSERSAAVLTRLLREAGIPTDLYQQLPAVRDAGPLLLEANIDHLVFTGSADVGRRIAVRLAERLIPSTLELSGCDAMVVLADANPVFAAKAAWFGVTLNRGQTCLAARRIFVARPIHSAFVAALRKHMASAEHMPLVTAPQVARANQLVADAQAKGGQLLSTPIGQLDTAAENCKWPQIVLNATPDMELCRVECFAPIAAVLSFDTMDELLALEERCPFALGASIFTADMKLAQRLAARMRAGSVSINDLIAPTAHPATPFGGRGASGWGVTRGAEGLQAMTTTQVISSRKGEFRPHYDGATPALTGLLRGLLNWTHAPAFGDRFRGLWATLRGLLRLGKKSD